MNSQQTSILASDNESLLSPKYNVVEIQKTISLECIMIHTIQLLFSDVDKPYKSVYLDGRFVLSRDKIQI